MTSSLLLLFIGMVMVSGRKMVNQECPECKTIMDGPWNGTYYFKKSNSADCNHVDDPVDKCLYTKDGTNYCFKKGGFTIETMCPDSGEKTTESGGDPCIDCMSEQIQCQDCETPCTEDREGDDCQSCLLEECPGCKDPCGYPEQTCMGCIGEHDQCQGCETPCDTDRDGDDCQNCLSDECSMCNVPCGFPETKGLTCIECVKETCQICYTPDQCSGQGGIFNNACGACLNFCSDCQAICTAELG